MTKPLGTLLAVDPGKTHAGVAFFYGGQLTAASLVSGKEPYDVAKNVEAWLWLLRERLPANVIPATGRVGCLVVEGQQIYTHSEANPNDLLPLAYVAGAVFARIPSYDRLHPKPREWAGSVPKDVRHRRLLSKLAPEALAVIDGLKCRAGLKHNVIDAIGLGMWALGKARPDNDQEWLQ